MTTEAAAGVEEVHILWISEGMSCDGDIGLDHRRRPAGDRGRPAGCHPGHPEGQPAQQGAVAYARRRGVPARRSARRLRDELDAPFVLVIEGSIPNEQINGEGYWTSFGNDENGEPLTLNWWIDQLAPKAWGVIAIGTCATYGGIHAMAGNPTGCMGLADYLGWDFRSAGGLPIVNVPGCPVQPENFMETLVWLLYAGGRPGADDPARRPAAPARGSSARRSTRAATAPATTSRATSRSDYNSPKCQVKIGCWGPVVNCNVPKRGWMARHRRLPERRRHLHRLHDARLPRQVHAVHGRSRPGGGALVRR